MSIYAELPDGRRLEFPDGTSPAVIQNTVKKLVSGKRKSLKEQNPAEYDSASPEFQAKYGPQYTAREQFGRGVGVGTRQVLEGSLGLADLLAEPARMGLRAVLPEQYAPQGTGAQALADLAGLPTEGNETERKIGMFSRPLAGAVTGAGGFGAIAPRVVESARPTAAFLAARPALQTQAAAGAGAGSLAASEMDLGPYGTLALQLAGGFAAPAGVRASQAMIEPVKDIGATIGASLGSKRAVERIMTDAVERGLANDPSAISNVRTAMYNATELVPGAKPTAGQAVAEFNSRAAAPGQERITGGFIPRLEKDLSGARGVEDVLPSVAKKQEAALVRAKDALETTTAKLREPVLNSIDRKAGGIDSGALKSSLDEIAALPEVTGDPGMSRAVQSVLRIVNRNEQGGRISAHSIYATRKSLNSTVEKALEQAGGVSYDRAKVGIIARQIQLAIDDAIESAARLSGAGKMWERYLNTYSEGINKIEAHTKRAEQATEIAKGVKPIGSQVAPGEVPHAPTLLNRTMMFANWGISKLGANANDPVVKELTKRLSDPAEFAKILQRPPKDPLRVLAMEAAKRGAISAGISVETLQEPQ